MEKSKAIELKQHIELKGDNPLDAVIAGTTRIKAYLVANLAILDGVDAAVKQYNISPAEVHAALTFYYDNEDAIRQANKEVMRKLREMGMQDMDDFRAEIERRRQQKNESSKQS